MGAANRHDRCPQSPKRTPSLRARRTFTGLKDTAKWHEGCTRPAIADTPRASRLRASRHEDLPSARRPVTMRPDGHTRKQAQGTTLSRVAETHGPSWARGNDEKDGSLGERPSAIGSDRFREATGRCTASRVAPGHAPSSTRRSAGGLQRFPKKAAALGALRYRHRREGRTRSPRCATRSARWASGSAVKGRPFMSLRIPVKCDIDPASTAGRPREQGDIHPLAERVTRAGRATRRDRIGGEHESDGRFWIASHGTS